LSRVRRERGPRRINVADQRCGIAAINATDPSPKSGESILIGINPQRDASRTGAGLVDHSARLQIGNTT
jgi:hypothetical protein